MALPTAQREHLRIGNVPRPILGRVVIPQPPPGSVDGIDRTVAASADQPMALPAALANHGWFRNCRRSRQSGIPIEQQAPSLIDRVQAA